MNKIDMMNERTKGTLMEFMGIRFSAYGDDWLEATMPINERTCTPAKIGHGGALMALAESVGSSLSFLNIDMEKQDVRGLEIKGNHLKAATGIVTARATLLHKGRTTHVCEIKIRNENGDLVNVSQMTNIVIERK
ncbi:MAG: PaaI family thioesterase [Salinivirgaceae bacterium]|nr:PaaI family thioesterase [Salinivirgaceae bacterium]